MFLAPQICRSGTSYLHVLRNLVTLFSIRQSLKAAATHPISTHLKSTHAQRHLSPAPSFSLVFPQHLPLSAQEPALKNCHGILQISFYTFLLYQKAISAEGNLKPGCSSLFSEPPVFKEGWQCPVSGHRSVPLANGHHSLPPPGATSIFPKSERN